MFIFTSGDDNDDLKVLSSLFLYNTFICNMIIMCYMLGTCPLCLLQIQPLHNYIGNAFPVLTAR